MLTRPQPFWERYIPAGAKRSYQLDWQGWLAAYWEPDQDVTVGQVRRPTSANGFEFRCTTAGHSAAEEPPWPTTLAATVQDGSAVWTCQAVSAASLLATVSSVSCTAPDGIAATAEQAGQITDVTIDATDSIAPSDYDIVFTATLSDGDVAPATFRARVR